jgi:drug/metabolite transporter (DMT)-like permease
VSAPTLRMGGREWRLLIGLSLCWGSSFLFFRTLSAALPPFTVALSRVGVAAVILNLIVLVMGKRLPADLKLWRQFAAMGFLTCVATFSLTALALRDISSGLGSILNAATPISSVLLAHVLTRNEKLTPQRVLGVGCGVVGVVILIGPSALKHLGGAETWAQLAVLAGTIFAALGSIYGRRFGGLPPLTVATGQLTAASAILTPLVLIFDRPWTLSAPTPHLWLNMLGFGVICTVIAFILFFKLLASAGATNLQLVTFLIPIVALFLGRWVLGEALDPHAYAGMAVIGLGLVLIDGRPVRWARRRLML